MSENKTSIITKMLTNAKPSNMEPEKKERVLRNIKRVIAVSAVATIATAAIATAKYYASIPDDEEFATSEDTETPEES